MHSALPAAGLGAAIRETIDNLASPAGLLFKSLLPRDPTGELLNVTRSAGALAHSRRAAMGSGSEATAARALAVAEIAAKVPTAMLKAQQSMQFVQRSRPRRPNRRRGGDKSVQLRLSGPGVFAVAARAKIERAAVRLSIASSILVVTLLLLVYRSLPALGLGLLPVATGALVGIARRGAGIRRRAWHHLGVRHYLDR